MKSQNLSSQKSSIKISILSMFYVCDFNMESLMALVMLFTSFNGSSWGIVKV